MRVFFSAGEASGDNYAAALTAALRRSFPEATFEGIGGVKSADAGITLIQNSSQWGAMGIVQGLKLLPKVARGIKVAKRAMCGGKPGLFIPIDYGFVNIRLVRHAKKHGWKVLYFIPPGSWRKDRQGADLPALTDAIVTPFPWSADLLNKMGANAHFFGHPLAELVDDIEEPRNRRGVAILPGSRTHEIGPHMEVLAAALKGHPGPFLFGVAPTVDPDDMRRQWKILGGGEAEFSRDIHQVLKSARVGVICSGTATLECALCGLPLVVIYRGTWLMRSEFRLRRPKFFAISLPNILFGKIVVPELIADAVTADAVRRELDIIEADGPERTAQMEAFDDIQHQLSGSRVFESTVDVVRSLYPTSDPSGTSNRL